MALRRHLLYMEKERESEGIEGCDGFKVKLLLTIGIR